MGTWVCSLRAQALGDILVVRWRKGAVCPHINATSVDESLSSMYYN